jgi:hypothetical protein
VADKPLCSVQKCHKQAHSGGMCSGHLHRLKRYGAATFTPDRMVPKECSVAGCEAQARSGGMCINHYLRNKKYGSPTGGRASPGERERWIRAHVGFQNDDCLPWPFGKPDRYGCLTVDGVTTGAHRLMCILAHGPAPSDRPETAHSCGFGLCVNPKHLRWANGAENHEDRLIHGTDIRGAKCYAAKLTEDQVRYIRSTAGVITAAELARRFDVAPVTVRAVRQWRTWVDTY